MCQIVIRKAGHEHLKSVINVHVTSYHVYDRFMALFYVHIQIKCFNTYSPHYKNLDGHPGQLTYNIRIKPTSLEQVKER